MKLGFSGLAGVMCLLFATAPVAGQEPYLDFVRGLRERQYFDMAVYYLDQLATRSTVPTDVKQLIPFEKASTLLESSRVVRSPEKQLEQLDQALAFLEQFVKESPNHARAGEANSERAQILLGKARVEISQSRSPANQGVRADFQNRARDLVKKARGVFETALKQHEEKWKGFGAFIDKDKESEKYEARHQSEINMIRSQLDLALCTYEEAQTYDQDSADYKRLLNDAANSFEQMHQRYRSQVGGLYARLWQGKCFEEQGDLQKALGIYNELLDHPGNDGAIARLKDQTLHFKLISLNSKQRNDHQLAVDLGEEWLKQNRAAARTAVGLGIRWEVARGYELLGDQRDLGKTEAQRYWRAARENAQQVNRFPGEYHDVSLALMQRLDGKLGGRERKPESFDAAFGLGRQLVTTIKETKDAIDAGRRNKQSADEIKKLQGDLDASLKEAAELFDLGLRLATPHDDAKSVTTARYMYAYVNFLMRKNYEAAILGEFVAKTADKDETTGLDAAYLSMAAYVQAYNDAKGSQDDKDADIGFIIKACNLLCDRWPGSDRANDARMTLGRIYSQLKQPVQAAEWYGKIPEADPKFPEAQLAAGQGYWTAFLSTRRPGEEGQPTAEQLNDWRTQAENLLKNGVQRLSATVPKEGAAPPELIAAKMSQAQIAISMGRDADAVKLLLDEPQSVIKAITVPDETKRPDKGVQSRTFASETYKLLLRAYIGTGKLDDARATMRTLEKVAGGEAGADVTDLYVGLGKLLRDELDRFQQAGETDRFNKLMTSFETFLNDLYQRKEGQTFGSLSWIGETYFALGEASEKDASRSISFYEKAGNAFQEILTKAESQPDFADPKQLLAVKVRLVRCSRLKKDFETGEKLLTDILAAEPRELRAQVEGAHLYKDWGSSGTTDNAAKLEYAIAGNPKVKLWGWSLLGSRLQASLSQGKPELLATFVEVRLNGSESRYMHALAQTSAQKKQEELDKAEMELVATVSLTNGLSEDQIAQFNDLFKKIKNDPTAVLKPNVNAEPLISSDEPPPEEKVAKKSTKATKKQAAKSEQSSGTMTALIAFGVILLAGAGVAAWMIMKRPHGHSAAAEAAAPADVGTVTIPTAIAPPASAGPFGAGGFAPPAATAPAPKPRPRPAAAAPATTAAGTAAPRPAATRPAAPKPAAGSAPAAGSPAATRPAEAPKPKPKPKPPAPPPA